MTGATPTTTAAVCDPYLEFIKALDTIEQSQLTMFVDAPLPAKKATIELYDSLVREAEVELDLQDRMCGDELHEKRIDIMREVLFKTIAQYNDKYANYIYPDALERYYARRNGKLVGIGLKYRADKGNYPLVIGTLLNGPSDGKNIKPGDRLAGVDGKSMSRLVAKDIAKILKGPLDSVARLDIVRGESSHTVTIRRAAVDLHYADSTMLEYDIGYVKISRFGSQTHVQVGGLLTELIEQGARSFILDLRDNPGGSTRAARAIVSMFSKEKIIYCEKDKTGAFKDLPRHGDHKTDLPLVVMINSGSMSCSEVVAGALKTFGRGTVVGTTSFGKGLVQRVFKLEQPLGGAVRASIALMGRPDQKLFHGKGIEPDVYISTDSDFMFKRVGSLNISSEARAFQRTLLESEVRSKKPRRAEEFIKAKDLQLQAAIDNLLPLLDLQDSDVPDG